jgi:phosphatidate phosphatase PAH1
MNDKQKTIFLDIDGTILEHKGNLHRMITEPPVVLNNVIEKFLEWRGAGHYIVLTTARAEGVRRITEQQLLNAGVFFDQLVMGLPNGPRILVNDSRPDGINTATAFCVTRDGGISEVEA